MCSIGALARTNTRSRKPRKLGRRTCRSDKARYRPHLMPLPLARTALEPTNLQFADSVLNALCCSGFPLHQPGMRTFVGGHRLCGTQSTDQLSHDSVVSQMHLGFLIKYPESAAES